MVQYSSACVSPGNAQGDGYLTHEEFKGMVASLNIKLSGEKIRSVIRAIDLDGGGYIDFPEFEAAVRRHEEVKGSPTRYITAQKYTKTRVRLCFV